MVHSVDLRPKWLNPTVLRKLFSTWPKPSKARAGLSNEGLRGLRRGEAERRWPVCTVPSTDIRGFFKRSRDTCLHNEETGVRILGNMIHSQQEEQQTQNWIFHEARSERRQGHGALHHCSCWVGTQKLTRPGYHGHPPNPACLRKGCSQLLPAPACTLNPCVGCPEDLRRGTPRYALDERLCSRVPSAESIQKNMFRFQLNFSNVSAATSKHQKTQTYKHFRSETRKVILALSG